MEISLNSLGFEVDESREMLAGARVIGELQCER